MSLLQYVNSFRINTITQGDTGSASRIQIQGLKAFQAYKSGFSVRLRICDQNGYANASNATIEVVAGKGTVVKTHTATKDLEIRSQTTAVAATGTLTFTGVTKDGETVTIGNRIYEFDTDGSVASGNVAVDTSGAATAAQGTLTVDTQPTVGDTMTIGTDTYVFVLDGTDNNGHEISVGADLPEAKANIVSKVNAYSSSVQLADFVGDDSVVTASTPGAGGNAILTTETFDESTNIFDAGTLGTTQTGVDAAAAASVTALAAAITGDASAVVTGVDGAGNTVDLTAKVTGTEGNDIATTETMAAGSFGGVKLSGGVASSGDIIQIDLTDASAETVTLRTGSPEIDGMSVNYADPTARHDVTHAAP